MGQAAYSDDRISVKAQEPEQDQSDLPFTDEEVFHAHRFHRSLPGYQPTPLVSLSAAAARHKVRSICVKDESVRFGLKAFKGLGGSYCMFRILCERLSLDYRTADYTAFLDNSIRKQCSRIEFVTATDGNHGKGVSWAAKLFGCKAHVFMPKGSSEARRRAIEEAGEATCRITDLNYDQTVRYAASVAEEKGWILIQDTSWGGYEKIPRWIIEGYLTITKEIEEQLDGIVPTHVFLQAGVGAMAGGVEACLTRRFCTGKLLTAIVEPREAACIYQSVLAGDGRAHSITGDPVTIMAGLNCGTPCGIMWPVLRDHSAFFCACDDVVTEAGMRAYAAPLGEDRPIVSGESGAVTYGLLLHILASDECRNLFGIRSGSVILLINTEGDTDPEEYHRIVG